MSSTRQATHRPWVKDAFQASDERGKPSVSTPQQQMWPSNRRRGPGDLEFQVCVRLNGSLVMQQDPLLNPSSASRLKIYMYTRGTPNRENSQLSSCFLSPRSISPGTASPPVRQRHHQEHFTLYLLCDEAQPVPTWKYVQKQPRGGNTGSCRGKK